MKILFLIILITFGAQGTSSSANSSFSVLNPVFDLRKNIKDQVLRTGFSKKLLTVDYNNQASLKIHQTKVANISAKIEQMYEAEFDKKFSKAEREYLINLFKHDLINRLLKYNTEFLNSPQVEATILSELKK